METSILIVGSDLDLHELLVDILEMTFPDAHIERALSADSMLAKLEVGETKYRLAVLDYTNGNGAGEELIPTLSRKHPELQGRIIAVVNSAGDPVDESVLHGVPSIAKPFSLDEFGELVESVCAPTGGDRGSSQS